MKLDNPSISLLSSFVVKKQDIISNVKEVAEIQRKACAYQK